MGAGITWVLLPCLTSVGFTGSASVGGGAGSQSHGHLSACRDDLRPTAIVTQLPVAIGSAVAGLEGTAPIGRGWG